MSARARRPRLPHTDVLVLVSVAEFILTVDLSIVNVALPAIHDELGFGIGSLPWVVNGYTVAFAGFLLLGGRLADLFDRRRVFLGALGAFTVASLLCGLAGDPVTLVAARIVQGLAAGVLAPTTLSIVTGTYRSEEHRRRALSAWTAVAIGGGAVGGLLGGVLTGLATWRAVFFVNVPVGAVLLAFAAARLPKGAGTAGRRRVDVLGALTATSGLTALVWAFSRSDQAGWTSAEVLGGLAAGAVLLGIFAWVEANVARAPLVPFAIFGSRTLLAGNLLSFLSFVPVMATWYVLTLYLQGLRGFTPVQTGLIFLPVSLAVIGGSQASFRLIRRIPAPHLVLGGGVLAAAGLTGFLGLTVTTSMVWVVAASTVTMAGGGLMFAPITVAATSPAEPEQEGLASGLLNTSRQLGGAVGLAVLSSVAAHVGDGPRAGNASAVSDGYATALFAGAVVFLVTTVLGELLLPKRPAASPQ